MKKRFIKQLKKCINCKGFSLLEVVVTIGVFAILMAIIMSILVINLKVGIRVKARSYVREESAFALNLLKKDIRNAEEVTGPSNPTLTKPTESYPLEVTVLDNEGDSHTYHWYQQDEQIVRRDDTEGRIVYKTPADVTFDLSAGFLVRVTEREDNWVVNVNLKTTTKGMPEGQWIYKNVAVSTRNIDFK